MRTRATLLFRPRKSRFVVWSFRSEQEPASFASGQTSASKAAVSKWSLTAWLGMFGRQGMRLRCASAAPCRCANHHHRHTLPATRNNLGALEIRGRDFVEAKMPPSNAFIGRPLATFRTRQREGVLRDLWRTGHAGRAHVHAGSEGRRPRRRGHRGCADWQGEDGVRRPRAQAVTVDCI